MIGQDQHAPDAPPADGDHPGVCVVALVTLF
jgi:hypothetical protein